ncbi:unnamed protein product, partial [Polarella glacialis]
MGGSRPSAAEGVHQSPVSGSCPAFADGCPYANNGDVFDWINQKRPDAISGCPAFKDGCPFNGVDDMDALRKQLEELPPSHARI